ncbi:MAG: hypothetical protein U0103_24690 [Candidatus Obscuribacterales bacterium]|nr:hypothetical protein [Cyanobacteria bacterium SZAS LIN-5]
MIRKSIVLAAAAVLALSSLSGVATAAPKAKTPAAATAVQGKSPAEIYDANHKGAVAVLTRFKTGISSPDVAGALAQIKTELDGLPALAKAYVDAKNAGDDAAAKTAQDSYTASVQKVIDLAVPLDQQVMPVRAQLMGGFEQLGAVGAKLKAEKDIAALIADIDAAMKPLDDANEMVGPIHDAAMKNTQTRMKQLGKKIFGEELANQIGNVLQQKLAQ